MASETLNHKAFESKNTSVVADAIRAMDLFITSQVARHSGEFDVDFIDSLEFAALDRAQTIISLSAAM